ncbi:DUF3788 family protein [candidate division KSB1 bacterium]|nr:MAG: DUF3788 family protein [candidate division KSB1 bacterium]
MPGSIFVDKAHKPTAKEVAAALGNAADLWDEFAQFIRDKYEPITDEWKFYKSWHWKLSRKKRTVCYFFAENNQFTVAFVFGEKAVAVAMQSKLPKKILSDIESARKYAEGRGFYVKAAKPSDLKHLQTLLAIKMAN